MKTKPKMKISIVGLGYVGLCTSVCMADQGFRVYGVEVDREKCDKLNSGVAPIHEKGLEKTLKRTLKKGLFSCSPDYKEAITNSDVVFLTVGTPSKPSGLIDLTYISSALSDVGKIIGSDEEYHLVVIKSTVLPGTTNGVAKKLLEEKSGKRAGDEFGLCVNPEFLREGSAIEDTMKPDAIVIGSTDDNSKKMLLKLYRNFYGSPLPKTILTTPANAEFIKYAINTFRATQLSYLNTLADMCEMVPSADIFEVVKGLTEVAKIDRRYRKAGLGFGGSCLPKDLRALTGLSNELGVENSILLSAASVNNRRSKRVAEIAQSLLGDLRKKRIALLGLAFKADTDDVRESVAIRIAQELKEAGAEVIAYDPQAVENARKLLRDDIQYAANTKACLKGAHCCVIATDWEEFKILNPSDFRNLMLSPVIIDGRRALDPERFESSEVVYHALGRYSSLEPLLTVQLSEKIEGGGKE